MTDDIKPKGVLFDPTQLIWTGANGEPIDGTKLFARVNGPRPDDTASAEMLKRLGISTDTPPAAGDSSHREI